MRIAQNIFTEICVGHEILDDGLNLLERQPLVKERRRERREALGRRGRQVRPVLGQHLEAAQVAHVGGGVDGLEVLTFVDSSG